MLTPYPQRFLQLYTTSLSFSFLLATPFLSPFTCLFIFFPSCHPTETYTNIPAPLVAPSLQTLRQFSLHLRNITRHPSAAPRWTLHYQGSLWSSNLGDECSLLLYGTDLSHQTPINSLTWPVSPRTKRRRDARCLTAPGKHFYFHFSHLFLFGYILWVDFLLSFLSFEDLASFLLDLKGKEVLIALRCSENPYFYLAQLFLFSQFPWGNYSILYSYD